MMDVECWMVDWGEEKPNGEFWMLNGGCWILNFGCWILDF
jgi:hypothetical protein